jgi:hypothetical protein
MKKLKIEEIVNKSKDKDGKIDLQEALVLYLESKVVEVKTKKLKQCQN